MESHLRHERLEVKLEGAVLLPRAEGEATIRGRKGATYADAAAQAEAGRKVSTRGSVRSRRLSDRRRRPDCRYPAPSGAHSRRQPSGRQGEIVLVSGPSTPKM